MEDIANPGDYRIDMTSENSPIQCLKNALPILDRLHCDVYDIQVFPENSRELRDVVTTCEPLLLVWCRIKNWCFCIRTEREIECMGRLFTSGQYINISTGETIKERTVSSVGRVDKVESMLLFMRTSNSLDDSNKIYSEYEKIPSALSSSGFQVGKFKWNLTGSQPQIHLNVHHTESGIDFIIYYYSGILYFSTEGILTKYHFQTYGGLCRKWYRKQGLISKVLYQNEKSVVFSMKDPNIHQTMKTSSAFTIDLFLRKVRDFVEVISYRNGSRDGLEWKSDKTISAMLKQRAKTLKIEIESNGVGPIDCIDPSLGLINNYHSFIKFFDHSDIYSRIIQSNHDLVEYFVSFPSIRLDLFLVTVHGITYSTICLSIFGEQDRKKLRKYIDQGDEWQRNIDMIKIYNLIENRDIPLLESLGDIDIHLIIKEKLHLLPKVNQFMGFIQTHTFSGSFNTCLENLVSLFDYYCGAFSKV